MFRLNISNMKKGHFLANVTGGYGVCIFRGTVSTSTQEHLIFCLVQNGENGFEIKDVAILPSSYSFFSIDRSISLKDGDLDVSIYPIINQEIGINYPASIGNSDSKRICEYITMNLE